MSESFHNLFDNQVREYSRFRPRYPRELVEFLSATAPASDLAWDAGTGNGQAASMLAEFFTRVFATDSSEAQIAQAAPHPKITYAVSPAEKCALADASCDLVTAANAVHWFDIPLFFEEAKRVLKPGGVIAIWCYGWCLAPSAIMGSIEPFYERIRPYWPSRTQLVKDQYRTLSFPFEEVVAPKFDLEEEWTLAHLLGYFSTWSAVQACKTQTGKDPIAQLSSDIASHHEATESKFKVTLPLYMRVGRKL